MKQLILSLSLLLIITLSSCAGGRKGGKTSDGDKNDSTLVKKTYHSTGAIWKVNRGKKVLVDGKTKFIMHGEVLEYYKTPEGALSSKTNFVNGKRNGMYTKYYTDGSVYYKVNYLDGKRFGVKTSYHKNGQVMAEVPYKKGLMGVGTKEYTPSGELIEPMTMKVWYKKNGSQVTVYAQAFNKGRATKRVEFFEGLLVEGKYVHKGLRKVPMKDGIGQITLSTHSGAVTITAKVKSARNNYSIVTKAIAIK